MNKEVIKATCTPDEVPEIAVILEKEKIPLLLCGPPSHGKTAAAVASVRAIARENYGIEEYVDSRIRRPKKGEYYLGMDNSTSMDPEDWCMPMFATRFNDESYVRKAVSSLAGSDQSWFQGGMTMADLYGTHIFEEVGKKPENFKIFAEMFNERSLGTHYLVPPNMYFIGTTNNAEDGAGAHDVFTDLASRVCRIEVRNTVTAFLKHHQGELDSLLQTVIKFQGENFLFTQQHEANGKPFSGPRTVISVNKLLNGGLDMSETLSQPILLGLIGMKGAVELLATYEAGSRLNNLDAMLDDPDAHRSEIESLADDNSHNGRQTLCALISMLGKRMTKDATLYNKYIKFAKLLNDEAAVTFTAVALSVNEKEIKKQPEFVRHYAKSDFYS